MKKPQFKPLTNKQLIIVISVSGVLLFALILYLVLGNNSSQNSTENTQKEPQVVTGTAENSADAFGLKNKDKPSSICERIGKKTVSKAIGETIDKIYASIPDSNTSEGSVAGCTYRVTTSDTQKIRSVIIVSRTLADQAAAKKAYDTLGKENGIKLDGVADEAYLISNSKQALVLKGTTITTISISTVNTATDSLEEIMTNLAKLL